ncbi:MAG: cyclomaltodextrinase C-terminal domain-containing protein [Paludibacter sp.]
MQNNVIELKRFSEILNGKTFGTEITTGEKFSLQNSLQIPAKTVLIIDVN